ncbi:hypothetical protein, partial [Coleofasciculus sp.]|uniref:hypothetical protein n=1 Tax=Coleofasciculus sp. TaxID=3100458 RepID=UPI003A316D59
SCLVVGASRCSNVTVSQFNAAGRPYGVCFEKISNLKMIKMIGIVKIIVVGCRGESLSQLGGIAINLSRLAPVSM